MNRTAPLRCGAPFALCLGLTLASLACHEGDPTPVQPEVSAAVEAVPMSFAVVESLNWREPIFATGTLYAEKTTDLAPRVDGIIDVIHVHVGDRVEAGQPLFQTRRADYEIRQREARYRLRLARASRTKAERDRTRARRLYNKGAASDERLDHSETTWLIADAEVGQAEAALARAELELEDTIVRAPYTGVITRRFINEGTMMKVMMPNEGPVIQIMKTDVVVAIAHLPETELPRLELGTPAIVRVRNLEREFSTEIHVLNDRLDSQTRAVEVRLGISNPDLLLKPGLFVEIEFAPDPRLVLSLDRASVLGGEGARHVYVLAGERAAHRPVFVRELDATRVEVLGGLEAGQAVLVGPNLPRVSEGTVVRVAHADR